MSTCDQCWAGEGVEVSASEALGSLMTSGLGSGSAAGRSWGLRVESYSETRWRGVSLQVGRRLENFVTAVPHRKSLWQS